MFTGIVEEMGTIRFIRRGAHSAVLSIGAELVLSDLKIGDSVAVNGVCLTATGKDSGGFGYIKSGVDGWSEAYPNCCKI